MIDGAEDASTAEGNLLTEDETSRREVLAAVVYERLHGPVAALGLVFVAVVVSEGVAPPGPIETLLLIAGWSLWGLFVVEFAARLVIAPHTGTFLRRNWWQVAFLVLPFLTFLRAVLFLRVARAGRLVAAAVRGSRSSAQALRSRLGWLASLSLVVVLLGADVLYEFGGIRDYGEALHAAALAAITGEPTGAASAVARTMDVVLGAYSVAVFGALAGAVGAFFLKREPVSA